jgi:hypothetical protein
MIDELLRTARRLRVTLNDLFIAATALACDQHGADPRRHGSDMAIGSIVDLRASSRENLDDTFSMFLGFTTVFVKARLLGERERLIRSIAAENAQLKESRAAQVSMIRMAVGYAQGIWLSPERLASFYRNYMPFSGGISNVNMNRSWPARYHPGRLVDYIRVAPTGPMVPVVIGVTTIGKRFNFVLTRRASIVDAERGKQLAQAFTDELTALAKMG